LTRCLQDGPEDILDFDKLDLLFTTGDARLNNWVSSAAVALAHALQIVENLFDPQTVLLGGAMPSGILDRLVELTELPIVSVSRRSDTSLPRLQRGVSGRMTATRGAAALILNQMFTPQIAVAT
jgi:predicted NBD/HSP70 family sugar kinase